MALRRIVRRRYRAPFSALPSHDAGAEGFTVIEAVLAVSLLVVAMLAIAQMFSASILVSGDTRSRVVAANLATQSIEQLRGFANDPIKFTTSIPIGRTVSTQTVGQVTYTITQDTEWVGQRAATSDCDSTPGSAQVLRATSSVTWPHMGATQPVQSTTTLSPPVGAYDPNSGSIAAKVFSASGGAQAGVPVTAVGPTSQTEVTTADGCAFFAYQTAGTYTVSLSAGGYVGDQEVASPSQTASVTVGGTTSLQFNYDLAARINVLGWSNPAPVAATGLPVSVANTGLQPYRSFSFSPGTSSLAPLYPYTSGYVLFAGSCTDADPIGLDTSSNPFYPGFSPTSVAVTPGGAVSAPVTLYRLALLVVDGTNKPITGTTLAATATGVTCPGGAPTYGVATTGSTGVYPSVPNSTTGVSLGKLHISTTSGKPITCPSINPSCADVWVKPDGTYDTTGTTKLTGAVILPVK
jgi:Tfp pilus assembly protein PilV